MKQKGQIHSLGRNKKSNKLLDELSNTSHHKPGDGLSNSASSSYQEILKRVKHKGDEKREALQHTLERYILNK